MQTSSPQADRPQDVTSLTLREGREPQSVALERSLKTADSVSTIIKGSDVDGPTIADLTKLYYSYEVACLGLKGTLRGAWASVVAIVAIVYAPLFSDKIVIEP